MQHQSYPPILVGEKVKTESGEFIVVWCPVCNIHHTHPFIEPEGAAAVVHIPVAQCSTGALVDTGYGVIVREDAEALLGKKKAKKK